MAGAPDDDLKPLHDALLRACEDYDADEAIRGRCKMGPVGAAKRKGRRDLLFGANQQIPQKRQNEEWSAKGHKP
jgi:hypothetical protein